MRLEFRMVGIRQSQGIQRQGGPFEGVGNPLGAVAVRVADQRRQCCLSCVLDDREDPALGSALEQEPFLVPLRRLGQRPVAEKAPGRSLVLRDARGQEFDNVHNQRVRPGAEVQARGYWAEPAFWVPSGAGTDRGR